MTWDQLIYNVVVPIGSFIFSVGVVYAGMKSKLESIPETINARLDGIENSFNIEIEKLEGTIDSCRRTHGTLEETLHRRISALCESSRENCHRLEGDIKGAHQRIDHIKDGS